MLSLQQLRTPLTEEQATDLVLTVMQSLGFETTGWQDGRIQKTIVQALATTVSDFSEVVKDIVEFGFNDYAVGEPLTLFSRSRFANDRVRAVKTRGPARLRSTASIPYTIQVGELIAATANGIEYRNVTGGTIAAGSTASPTALQLVFEARVAGASSNVGLHQITRLLTPLAGVTIDNDAGTPWYTTAGADEESNAVLQRRNSTKWSLLSLELVAEAYIQIALTNGARKAALHDQNPRGPGTIDVYVAGDDALLGNVTLEALQAVFAGRTFYTDENWPAAAESRVAVKHATLQALNITATIYHDANVSGGDMSDRVFDALQDFLVLTPLGGWSYATLENVITVGQIYEALEAVEGVQTVVIALPTGTTAIAPFALVTEGTWNLVYQPVAV